MRNSILAVAILLCVGVWGFVAFNTYRMPHDSDVQAPRSFEECVASGGEVESLAPARCSAGGQVFVENIGNAAEKRSLIRVDSPRPGSVVASPLVVKGRARGMWFFEASFPVVLIAQNNVVIATGTAQANDDWMTEEFVPFTATLQFTKPMHVRTGTLLLKKDNPSGDPERDDALFIPVKL